MGKLKNMLYQMNTIQNRLLHLSHHVISPSFCLLYHIQTLVSCFFIFKCFPSLVDYWKGSEFFLK